MNEETKETSQKPEAGELSVVVRKIERVAGAQRGSSAAAMAAPYCGHCHCGHCHCGHCHCGHCGCSRS